jgi:hypothetical protein
LAVLSQEEEKVKKEYWQFSVSKCLFLLNQGEICLPQSTVKSDEPILSELQKKFDALVAVKICFFVVTDFGTRLNNVIVLPCLGNGLTRKFYTRLNFFPRQKINLLRSAISEEGKKIL